jgi:hypothetical protein
MLLDKGDAPIAMKNAFRAMGLQQQSSIPILALLSHYPRRVQSSLKISYQSALPTMHHSWAPSVDPFCTSQSATLVERIERQ